jgi:CRISPR-associated protein Cas2
MMTIVTYDIVCNRRRARLHRTLKEFGLNTQKSVFECEVDKETLLRLAAAARAYIDPDEDSLRIYRVCAACQRQVGISGQGLKLVTLDFMVV